MKTSDQSLAELTRKKLEQSLSKIEIEELENLHQITMEQVEQALIDYVLEAADGNQAKASKILGLSRNTLKRKKDKYHL